MSQAGIQRAVHTLHTLTISSLGAVRDRAVPENEYMPFTIAKPNRGGKFKATQGQNIHYTNVDSGAQVLCITSAVLDAFPGLRHYFRKEQAMVVGIGSTETVMGVLEDVPVHVGTGPVHPPAIVHVDFCMLCGTGYSLILSR